MSTGYKPISIGVVAENKLLTSNEVEVLLLEKQPFFNGELKSQTDQVVTKAGNGGMHKEFAVNISNTVVATWKGSETGNRATSPDVRRGTRVQVWQYANTDKYYWSELEEPGKSLRKTEIVRHTFSNSRDESDNEKSPDNSWYWEVDTVNKLITVKTNKNDGEPYEYTVQIDAKSGNFVVADDTGNYVQLNSQEERIELGTASGGLLDIHGRNMRLVADTLDVDVKQTNFNGDMVTFLAQILAKAQMTNEANVDFKADVINKGKSIGKDHRHKETNNVTLGVE